MALNFPSSPSTNDTYVLGSRTWRYNGTAWQLVGERGGAYVHRSYTGDGNTTVFTVTSGTTVDDVVVTENGIIQKPTTDYTITGDSLTFVTAPANNVVIGIRELAVGGGISTTGTADPTIHPFMLAGM